MNEKLYDLLVDGGVFTHGIGDIKDDDVISKFESVIKLNGLYSKEKLRKLNYNVTGKVSGYIRNTNERYISLFDPSLGSLRKQLLSDKIKNLPLGLNDITFLIDNSIESDALARRHEIISSELIVKDYLPFDYFIGIVIPNDEKIKKEVINILIQYDIELLVYDIEGNEIKYSRKIK